jgi:DNA-binding NarL/FixJ family response regulator
MCERQGASVGIAWSIEPAPAHRLLTAQEGRVLELIAAGLSNLEAAEQLFLSRQTVGYHVQNLLRKFRVDNRTGLVAKAFSHGLLRVGVWPPVLAVWEPGDDSARVARRGLG